MSGGRFWCRSNEPWRCGDVSAAGAQFVLRFVFTSDDVMVGIRMEEDGGVEWAERKEIDVSRVWRSGKIFHLSLPWFLPHGKEEMEERYPSALISLSLSLPSTREDNWTGANTDPGFKCRLCILHSIGRGR